MAKKAVKMWAIADNEILVRKLNGTMELFKSRRQVAARLRDVPTIGLSMVGCEPVPVLITPLPTRRAGK